MRGPYIVNFNIATLFPLFEVKDTFKLTTSSKDRRVWEWKTSDKYI